MKIKNTKGAAIILILLGIAALFFMGKSILDRNKEPAFGEKEPEEIAEETTIEDAPVGKEGISPSESESVASSIPEEKKSLNNIESIFNYDVHTAIEELLDPEKFDRELTSFLYEKGKLPEIAHDSEDAPHGIFLVKSVNYLTLDLENDVYIFSLNIDNAEKSVVTVSTKDNEYYFEVI